MYTIIATSPLGHQMQLSMIDGVFTPKVDSDNYNPAYFATFEEALVELPNLYHSADDGWEFEPVEVSL